jgi:hypothetical protein
MAPKDKSIELLEELVAAVQDLFILHALEAGITAEKVRELVGVDKKRVTRVSKVRKKAPKI